MLIIIIKKYHFWIFNGFEILNYDVNIRIIIKFQIRVSKLFNNVIAKLSNLFVTVISLRHSLLNN